MHRMHCPWQAVLVGFTLGAAALAQAPASPSLLDQARGAYLQRGAAVQARKAVDLFAQAAAAAPTSYEARWEGARACYFLGTWAEPEMDEDEKLALFQNGIDRAKAAVALDPKGAEGHFWLGVLYGVYGETKGIFKSLAMVPGIQSEMAECLKIDRAVEGYGPDRLLGRLYFKLPGFKGGDNRKSIEHLERAVQGEPLNALTRLYLAETYRAEDMDEKAREQLRTILAMTPDPRWRPEHPAIRSQAEALLKKLS
jgi:tetratricopeptide (TPR) repeat protein